MKLYLFLALSIGLYAYAELPGTIKDGPTRDTTEYLDGKIDNINKSFVDSKSTATFAGWVDIGWERTDTATTCGNGPSCSITCSTGKKIVSGGCYAGNDEYWINSYPNADNSWSCLWGASATAKKAYAICARVK